ncbi:P-loop containing nucleoside triphosphate hydrolase protein [Peniophora sp. CONT]|nr:P-loop containing nucleoside triphosphate hydrolase protein [Peniophora sp. CONT]
MRRTQTILQQALRAARRNLNDGFEKHSSSGKFLAAAQTISSIPELHGLPEVVVAGRANAGKSTLLNAVVGRTTAPLMHSSKKAGRTRALNFFSVGPSAYGKLILVDAPGYGRVSKQEWGELFEHYIEQRTQLRRVYVLLNAPHGIGKSDELFLEMLDALSQTGSVPWTYQAIFTQIDRMSTAQIGEMAKLKDELHRIAPTCLPPLFTASLKPRLGIESVRSSILEACGLLTLD